MRQSKQKGKELRTKEGTEISNWLRKPKSGAVSVGLQVAMLSYFSNDCDELLLYSREAASHCPHGSSFL